MQSCMNLQGMSSLVTAVGAVHFALEALACGVSDYSAASTNRQ